MKSVVKIGLTDESASKLEYLFQYFFYATFKLMFN